MIAFIQPIHGYFRWLVLAVALIALLKFVIGWLGKGKVTPLDQTLGRVFAIVMTIQLVLGVLNLLGYVLAGAFNPKGQIEHAVYGLLATGMSHALPLRKTERPDSARFMMSAVFVLLSLAMLLFSVIRLRGGWVF
jgi:heme A synthase